LVLESKKSGSGRPPRKARVRVLRALKVWWDREVAAELGPARLPNGKFNGSFISFLCDVNAALHAEVSRINIGRREARRRHIDQVPIARWLPETLPLGPRDASQGRRTIIAALSKVIIF
jgi:hypothetical protein